MSKKIMVTMGIIMLIICGCSNKKENEKQGVKMYNTNSYENNSELDQIISKNNFIIVDVRTKEEYDTGHVKGAINIPYDSIDENTNLDKSKTILVYCKSGVRSGKAYQTLKKLNYDVYDLGAYSSIDLDKE